MGGGWRWPVRPFQVGCVVAVDLPIAAISQEFAAAERGGPRPRAEIDLIAPGERLNADAAVSRKPRHRATRRKRSSDRTCCKQRVSGLAGVSDPTHGLTTGG